MREGFHSTDETLLNTGHTLLLVQRLLPFAVKAIVQSIDRLLPFAVESIVQRQGRQADNSR